MLLVGVEAKSLPLAKGEGAGVERGDNHFSNTFKFFSKESRIHIYVILYLMFIAFMNKVNFHEHFFIILDS